jgi:hypothetical protein
MKVVESNGGKHSVLKTAFNLNYELTSVEWLSEMEPYIWCSSQGYMTRLSQNQ